MLTEERQQMIAHYVDEHQICRVTELCRLTSTSESTIRRDLSEMEDRGLLKRVHGGVQSLQTFGQDVAQQIRFNLNKDDIILKKGDRICQIVIEPVILADLVEDLGDEREDGGFGSSGK